MIGCNYIFSPPNFCTGFVSDISSRTQSSSCSITWNWETHLGHQTVLTVVIKQSATCFKLQGKGFFQYSADCGNAGETYQVGPKSNENDFFKKNLLNMHAITVYPLQSSILAIEYSDSGIAATLHCSGGSLHLRCCSKPSSQLPGRFQVSQNDIL